MSRIFPALVLTLALGVCLGAQSSPKAAMLEQAGWDALDAGKVQAAADAFREAARLDLKSGRIRLGLGFAAVLQKRDDDAKQAFTEALALDPTLIRARVQLAQIMRRQGDLPGAIREYENIAAETRDAGIRDTLERWKRELELHERMQLAVGNHFTVSFEGPEDAKLAEEALASLDRAFWRVCDVFGVFPTESIKVVLYSTVQFSDITRAPQWAAGAYDGIIRVPMRGALERTAELDRVLAHEFVHALIRTMASRGVPTWLNEGLASALESDSLSWAETRIRKASAIPPLSDLQTGFGRFTGNQAQVAYAASAMAAKRLLDEAGGAAIANLLRDLGAGVTFEDAFLHRTQRTFADFQAALGQ